MKKTKTLLLCIFMMLTVITAYAQNPYDDGNFIYLCNDDGTATIISVSSNTNTTLNIPNSFTYEAVSYSVTAIGESAFEYSDGDTEYESVTIANTIKTIGERAFSGQSKLATLTFENGSQLTSIGDYAFNACSKLSSVSLPDGVTEIANGTFGDNYELNSITWTNVKSIGENAFQNSQNLKSIDLTGVESIGSMCFNQSALTSITIPASVKTIGSLAFSNCQDLVTVTFAENGELREIADELFESSGITTIEIPDYIETVGEKAFGQSSLNSIVFGSNIKSIGNNVFEYIINNNTYSGLNVTINALKPTLGDNPFGEQISEPDIKPTLIISPCANIDDFSNWANDFDISGGLTIDESLLSITDTKTYDGTAVFEYDSSPIDLGNGTQIELTGAESGYINYNQQQQKEWLPVSSVTSDMTLNLQITYNITQNGQTCATDNTLILNDITPTIEPKKITKENLQELIELTKVYDGGIYAYAKTSEKLENSGTNLSCKGTTWIVDNDDVYITLGAVSYNDANVGDNKTISATPYITSGNDFNNYTLDDEINTQPPYVTFEGGSITPKPIKTDNIDIIGDLKLTKDYDGTNVIAEVGELQQNINIRITEGLVGDDSQPFHIYSASYDNANAGKNKKIYLYLNVSNQNYIFEDNKEEFEYLFSEEGIIRDNVVLTLNGTEFPFGERTSVVGENIVATATEENSVNQVSGTFTYSPEKGTLLQLGQKQVINVSFTPDEDHDYLYDAQKEFYVDIIDKFVAENIQDSIDMQTFCSDGAAYLTFSAVAGEAVKYSITFDTHDDNLGSQIPAQEGDIPEGKNYIQLQLPSDLYAGDYTGKVVFLTSSDIESDSYNFKITVNIPKEVVKKLYDDVIFADNHQLLYTGYQWKKDGVEVSGENKQFYTEQVLNGVYSVILTLKNGGQVETCPLETKTATSKKHSTVKIYPNPALANRQFNLQIVDTESIDGAEIYIFNNSGVLVEHITNVKVQNSLSLPKGSYSGALVKDGQKNSFKIIVEQ